MIRSEFEYLFILAVLLLLALSLFLDEIIRVSRSRYFWESFIIYFFACTVFDYIAIASGWWIFNKEKIVGIDLLSIPVEEFILFSLIYMIVIGAWEMHEQ